MAEAEAMIDERERPITISIPRRTSPLDPFSVQGPVPPGLYALAAETMTLVAEMADGGALVPRAVIGPGVYAMVVQTWPMQGSMATPVLVTRSFTAQRITAIQTACWDTSRIVFDG